MSREKKIKDQSSPFRDKKRFPWEKDSRQVLPQNHKDLLHELKERQAELKEVNRQLQKEIAGRKRAEERLRETQKQAYSLGRFPEKNPNPMLGVSAEGIVLYRNPAAARVPEWGCEVGRPLPSQLRQLVGRAIANGKEAQEDLQMGGRTYFVLASAFPENDYVIVYGRDITKRRRIEEELRLSMEGLHLALDASKSGVWEWDLQTNKNVWSEELWKIYGLEPHSCEPSYEAWLKTILPEDRAKAERLVQEAARKGAEFDAEWRVQGLEGMERWLMSRGSPFRDADGRVMRFIGIVTDITERKKTEEEIRRLNAELEAKVTKRTVQLEAKNAALKEEIAERKQAEEEARRNEKEFRAIFELSAVGMAQRDPSTGLMTRVNQKFCEMTGYSKRELLNQKDTILTHPDDWERDKEVQAGVFKGESDTWFIEKRYLRKNGEVIWVLVHGRLVRESFGRPFRIMAVIQDITARKKAEEELQKSQIDLNRAQAVAHTGSWRLDTRRNELAWSDETHRIFGIPRGTTMTYARFLDAIHPDDREDVDKKWKAATRGGGYDIEHRILVDGAVKWVRERAELEFDKTGALLGGFGTAQEITERKEAEQKIQKLNQELSRKAFELEAANKELDAFTSAVSHDLKNQLIVISAFSRRLRKRYSEKLDAKGQEYVEMIHSSVENMISLVGDLLELSRVSEAALNIEPLDLSELAGSVLKKYQEKDAKRQVEVVIPEKIEAQGDRRLLTVVLDNLLNNAWKFTKDSDPARIELGFSPASAEPVYFVRDNGCGFCVPVDPEQIFVPFARFHKGEDYPGTGVGLATVKRIISRHGGKIWAESIVGKGTVFYFQL